ncbi:sugar ABC transporter ATP-binding protein [Amycolatopsis rubida]|uniref:Simple sugar transport system ATP-binding protein n=1 Tax=Amycolatopsis rubida TaxID=112413 RepID=A0A1I5N1R9_9PSEU|nr:MULTISPECIES: ATP-binding cassette domain-containing protein [Amycolatopsis]MYW92773.1 ATP-binding cassette domain-containing protein [Amycolatopsis rubida]NEC57759.1 sugar ABC transporter ATP-binding protein [Amycolatopsis rubida]OAP24917.1 Arabinose import ATP-binding protein AraG [Amycolatopsis sp. M39]SFP15572.1 simple sugar transport system ATP-binding protein [Amycolatopsis rubida]
MSEILLDAVDLTKHYGSVEALRGASFQARAGEVTALIGDNGAGKSTLVKCLSGAEQPTSGRILLDGKEVRLDSPVAARRAGIETVYQDLAVAPELDPAANLFLGREIPRKGILGKLGMLDKAEMRRQAVTEFEKLGVKLQSSEVSIGSLSGGQRQSVAVARSVAWASKVVFMDEPTAALGVRQRERVLDVIRKVRDKGIAVVLISHNMPEVLSVSDRIEVLLQGKRVARFTGADTKLEDLVAAMTGALVQEEAA